MSSITYTYLPETASTNTFAKENIHDFPYGFRVVYTQNQTAGRGMDSNSWEAEAGKNISFSIVCHPKMVKPSEQFVLSMAIAVDIVKSLKDLIPEEKDNFRIKWPNDIYWKDRKLSGILIENSLKGFRMDTCIIGIGININQEKFLSDAPNPVSLKQICGKDCDGIKLMDAICERYKKTLQIIKLLENQDNRALSIAYESICDNYHRLLYRNDNDWHAFQDTEIFHAKLVKVQDDGRLLLHREDGTEKEYWLKEVKFII